MRAILTHARGFVPSHYASGGRATSRLGLLTRVYVLTRIDRHNDKPS